MTTPEKATLKDLMDLMRKILEEHFPDAQRIALVITHREDQPKTVINVFREEPIPFVATPA